MNRELPYTKILVDSAAWDIMSSELGNPTALKVKIASSKSGEPRTMLPKNTNSFNGLVSINLGAFVIDAYLELISKVEMIVSNMVGVDISVNKNANLIARQMAVPKCFKMYEQSVKLPDNQGGYIVIPQLSSGEEYARLVSMSSNLFNLGYLDKNFLTFRD